MDGAVNLWDVIHKIYVEILVTGLGLVNIVVHGEELAEKFDKLLGIKKYIERRIGERRHNVENILSYIGLAKYAIPVIDAIVKELQAAIPAEKSDLVAAYQAFEKSWADAKTSFEALVVAVKQAVSGTPAV